jgi:hypothetical protein
MPALNQPWRRWGEYAVLGVRLSITRRSGEMRRCQASRWQVRGDNRETDDRRRCRHRGGPRRRAGADRGRGPVGPEHGAARRDRVRERPGERYESRQLHASSHGRRARTRHRVHRQYGGAGRPARKIRELLVRRLGGDVRIPAKSTIHAIQDWKCAGRPARSRWCKSTTMKEHLP